MNVVAVRPFLASPPAAPTASPPPDWLRGAVREVLERSPGYAELSPEHRRALAQSMVRVSAMAADLLTEENEAQAQIETASAQAQALAAPSDPAAQRPVARAMDAPPFGTATDRIADTTRNVLGAISFPRFVTDLVNGVFRAMLDSTSQQMQMYVQLLNNVSASAEGFERTQYPLVAVRRWVAEHFPESIEYDEPELEPGETPDPDDVRAAEEIQLRLRSGARMPSAEDIRAVLGMEPTESVDAGNPEQLVPLARRHIARQRQQMLATMVQMGMQRIVIDSGKINAAMRFHIDTRSAANSDQGSQFGMQNRVRAGGSFGIGAWGASAEVENTISYVSTQRTQNTEEINTDVELNSSVELNFRTDYLPLNRMAADAQADRIRNASLNPVAETSSATSASAERQARLAAQHTAEQQRQSSISGAIDAASRMAPASTPLPIPGQRTGTTTGSSSGTTAASGSTTTASGSGAASGTVTAPASGTAPRTTTTPASGTASTGTPPVSGATRPASGATH
ncbi:hypothetical protein [Chitiniphilus eburneus]|uniref:Uncharacterized protein n=1 Tax=Chitiniphilus eburneus TaxID=2571148 RepID=A0A4U0QJG2_9NEIS|nr:hypothetical protein [Chitiniphilus eburneus]TJZ76204.1 hypothetical protein FAZ21_05360 [Chitiniphilus eburneus]